jgi:hypothetical protein
MRRIPASAGVLLALLIPAEAATAADAPRAVVAAEVEAPIAEVWDAFTTTAGLGQFAMNVINGKAKIDSLKDVFAAYGKYTSGAKWNGNGWQLHCF